MGGRGKREGKTARKGARASTLECSLARSHTCSLTALEMCARTRAHAHPRSPSSQRIQQPAQSPSRRALTALLISIRRAVVRLGPCQCRAHHLRLPGLPRGPGPSLTRKYSPTPTPSPLQLESLQCFSLSALAKLEQRFVLALCLSCVFGKSLLHASTTVTVSPEQPDCTTICLDM